MTWNVRSRATWVGLLAALCVCAGCRTTGPIGQPRKYVKPVVAVESFENRAPFPLRWQLGDGMAELLIASLVKSERVTVVSRAALQSVFEELQLQRDPHFRREGRVAHGRLKNAQYLVRGTVLDFTHTSGGSLHFMRGLARGRAGAQVALVTVAVSVIDVESRQVVSKTFNGRAWASQVSLEGTYRGVAFGGSAFHRTPLGKATGDAIWDAVHWVVKEIAGRAWAPRIAQVEGELVYLSGGKDRRMSVGEELEVYEPGEPILDPATGDEIGRGPECLVGRLSVTEVQERLSVARILSGSGFRAGQACRRAKPREGTQTPKP